MQLICNFRKHIYIDVYDCFAELNVRALCRGSRPAFTTRTKQFLSGSCFTAYAQQIGLLEPYHLYILTV